MAKQVIRLTEGDLHRIIKESVNRVLSEAVFGDEYRDNTIPQEMQSIYYYARSWYKEALDELQNKDYLFPETLAHLNSELRQLIILRSKYGSKCPENVHKVHDGIKELLLTYDKDWRK